MHHYACIGSRALTPEQLAICFTLGQWIVKRGHFVDSGNADGADGAFAAGGNTVDPTHVWLHLPWPKFNAHQITPGNRFRVLEQIPPADQQWMHELAAKYHPNYTYLRQGAKKLHARNGMITYSVQPREPVFSVLAWPSDKPGGGGTGQGIRIAEGEGIPLVRLDLCSREDLRALCVAIQAGQVWSNA
jgi:hypothetical protein